jgi:hypothetical protein
MSMTTASSGTLPVSSLAAVVPSDTVSFPVCKMLQVGGAGVINILAEDDTVAVALTVLAGTLLPIRAKRVNATGTTATLIVALY